MTLFSPLLSSSNLLFSNLSPVSLTGKPNKYLSRELGPISSYAELRKGAGWILVTAKKVSEGSEGM